ncbi:hypothetical protein [Edaphobacter modestus]|uniref:Uncharacterized protein n=1 Tax=Edaphobacter modestus TaxID=388466 RepID=A0A4Q7YVL5_9BACT|nr:hypothetical protein [Edaphobacter modestus]RZU41698.1 hypothetical protein BDD14_3225 [Edaphobacter modestus]
MKVNQPTQKNPGRGNKQGKPSGGQQAQQGNRPRQGGYSTPGQGSHGGQSAPADKK